MFCVIDFFEEFWEVVQSYPEGSGKVSGKMLPQSIHNFEFEFFLRRLFVFRLFRLPFLFQHWTKHTTQKYIFVHVLSKDLHLPQVPQVEQEEFRNLPNKRADAIPGWFPSSTSACRPQTCFFPPVRHKHIQEVFSADHSFFSWHGGHAPPLSL